MKRVKSLLKRKGLAKSNKPMVRGITLTFCDSQDWKQSIVQ